MNPPQSIDSRRALLVCLALAGLLLRVLVPAGHMPAVTDQGWTVILCTGDGPATVVMDLDGETRHAPADKGQGEQPCAFASLSSPMLAAAPSAIVAIAVAYLMAGALRPERPRLRLGRRRLRPPTQGPPLLFALA